MSTQNLLQGFGIARQQPLHSRGQEQLEGDRSAIEAAGDHHRFRRSESLLGSGELQRGLRIKEQALATAQKLYEDNQNRLSWERCRPSKLRARRPRFPPTKENLLIAQTNVAQQETVLKNALSRNGVVSRWLDEVHIIPLDHIVVPEKEDLKTKAELVEQALANRPEIEQTKINIESHKINLAGTKNASLPTLAGICRTDQ